MVRIDGRENRDIRDVRITRNYTKYADGSVLIECGNTKVICTAVIEDKVPPFLKGSGEGWLTCEYGMLPMSTQSRKQRDINKLKLDGRTAEIQRLIGRSLRSIIDLKMIGERTIMVDCDVIQADGGTRTASITGAFIALIDALKKLRSNEKIEAFPVSSFLAAVSVGIIEDEVLLDLCYEEDSNAMVDMNVVMTDKEEFIEIQGTGEKRPFSKAQMSDLLSAAEIGIKRLIELQTRCLGEDSSLLLKLEDQDGTSL